MAINVPIFRYLNKEQGKEMAKAFKIIKCKKGEIILTNAKPVPGIFIVIEGAVDVYTEKFETFLTRLEYGNTIGEMSLIENRTASASVRVAENGTVLLLCKSADFRKIGKERREIPKASKTSIAHLETILPMIETMKDHSPEDKEMLTQMSTSINNAIKTEIMNFERINKRVSKMQNYLDGNSKTI